ncbi:hypothetical protein IEQ34_013942 [Dendrobium chrysotoxum]|uniref:Uncharacterized protein n=1 Tax=Dendrobium chrysotoxum TaxID=161865 RepID=A0AAV7GJR9_DENCH|nr:hypothetical protein IEQ34_013942 [Dendrobium chrysotoxum]
MVIRIKLPSKELKVQEQESVSTDPCCSSSVTKKPKIQACLAESAPRSSSQVSKTSKITESATQSSSQVTKTSKVQEILTGSAPHRPQVTKKSRVQADLTKSAPLTKKPKVQACLTESAPSCSYQVTKASKGKAVLTESAPSCSSQVTKASNVKAAFTKSGPRCSALVTKPSKPQAVLTKSAPLCSAKVTKPSKPRAILTKSAPRFFTESASRCCSQTTKLSKSESLTESGLRTKKQSNRWQLLSLASLFLSPSCPFFKKALLRPIPVNLGTKTAKPPSIQPIEADEDELDWLFAPRKSQFCNAPISDPSFQDKFLHKLQIQWGNTKQRKQLSRKVNEKQNKKRSREEHDNLDSLQRKNKKRKADKNIKFNKSFHFARKEFADHLERSDLSEEHDPPALVLNKCNSSKGTQNSKNGNAVMDSDPKKQRPGMVIRIKLPSKKQKDPEPESASINPSCSSIFTKSSSAQAFLTDACCSSQVTKPSEVQAILTGSGPLGSSEVTKLSKVKAVSTGRCSFQVTKPSETHAVLTKSASCCCSQGSKQSQSESVLTESALRTKELPSAKQPETIAQPSISGPFSTPPILQESFVQANPSEYRHKRSSGGNCTQRSESQLSRDLIMNWKPPSIQLLEADEAELDWLFATQKSQDAKPSAQICIAGVSNPSTYPSSASSLQPRATYLPEFNMYQMPYVIPF